MTIDFVLVSVILFFIIMVLTMEYLISKKISLRKTIKKINSLAENLLPIMTKHILAENMTNIPESELSQIKKIIHSYIGIEAFNKVSSELVQAHGCPYKVNEYAAMVLDVNLLLKNNLIDGGDALKIEYILYLFSKYKITREEAMEFAFDSLDVQSLSIRNTALTVIKNTKNPRHMINVYEIISKQGHYFNDKVLIDFVDSYNGDQRTLNEMLLKNIWKFNEQIQIAIIEHFINVKFEFGGSDILTLIEKTSYKEAVIAGLKYFKIFPYDYAKNLINKSIVNDSYEVRAIAATALASYNYEESLKVLTRSISDSNWFVRYNSAFSILSLTKGNYKENSVIENIINGEDKYAREIMIYALFSKDFINIETYNELIKNKVQEEIPV